MSVQAVVQLVPAARLHVPGVRHCRLASAGVAPEHAFPFFAPELASHLPGHCVFSVHAPPPVAHVPPLTGQLAPEEHEAAAAQEPSGQFAFVVHGFWSFVPPLQTLWPQVPFVAVQSAADAHDLFDGFLQMPQSVSNRHTRLALLLHTPESGQSVLLVQAPLLLLQVPPMTAQSLTASEQVF